MWSMDCRFVMSLVSKDAIPRPFCARYAGLKTEGTTLSLMKPWTVLAP